MRKILACAALALAAAGCGSSSSSTASPSRAAATAGPSRTASPAVTRSMSPMVTCTPMTSKGNCFLPGQQCPVRDYRTYGTAATGQTILCKDVKGTWRWTVTASTLVPAGS
jgi:hypothetical protein